MGGLVSGIANFFTGGGTSTSTAQAQQNALNAQAIQDYEAQQNAASVTAAQQAEQQNAEQQNQQLLLDAARQAQAGNTTAIPVNTAGLAALLGNAGGAFGAGKLGNNEGGASQGTFLGR